jgi:hypothetical protein
MKPVTSACLLLSVLLALPASASSAHDPISVVQRYFEAHDREAKAACLSPDFRIWFEKQSGEGVSRSETLEDSGWDQALRARSRLVRMDVRGDTVVVLVHEDNDFSLLIGYPGWDPTITFIVDHEGLIERALYVPKAGAPSWRSALEPALPWLREHRGEALNRVFPAGKLVRTREAAKEWVAILRAWRKTTGQADPTDPD